MTYSNKATVNFAGGEASPEMTARSDLPLFSKVLARMQNWIADPKGPARFRNGSVFVHYTRRSNKAVFIPFQFNDSQSYLIEATVGYFRFHKAGGLIYKNPVNITGATQASPGVITSAGHGLVTGDEIFIDDVVGMTQLNGKSYLVVRINANTFSLTDLFGNAINTTGYTAYSSGGTFEQVYEVRTPYREADLETLAYDQNQDTMYLVHQDYLPHKLTRSSDISWSFGTYARTADPFGGSYGNGLALTGITQANPGVVTTALAHGLVAGDKCYIKSVAGMTEMNERHFTVNTAPTTTTLTLLDENGAVLDTSGYTAYSASGVLDRIEGGNCPGAVAFTDDARLVMAGTEDSPETLWFSRGPTAAGAVRFDDFTTGADANHAVIFTLAPLRGKVDAIRWITNTDKYIAVGTFGSVRRIYGASEAEPITPSSITAKGVNADGVQRTRPVLAESALFYIQRGGGSLQSIEYDYAIDGYVPDDKNLVSDHLTVGGLKCIVRQVARPTVIWAVRNDGLLLGLTHKSKENISGWHRHKFTNATVEWVGVLPRESDNDQLWLIVKRTINGQTVRFIEYMADPPDFPDEADFFTEETQLDQDRERFLNYQSEIAKDAIHLDASATYDGSSYGTAAGASIDMGGDADVADAEDVTVTASAAVFTSDMVGRQIWGAYTNEGIGGGRLEITEYVSTTVVKGTIIDTFPALATYPAGDWYITATSVSGLDYLELETVGVIADGAAPDLEVVESGAISIDEPASVIHVGLRYLGFMKTMPLDQGGTSGPAQSKLKIVTRTAIRFVNSAGVKFGTSPYRLTELNFRRGNDFTGRPIPLLTGVDEQLYGDSWSAEKALYIVQENPLPCTVASLDIFTETTDE